MKPSDDWRYVIVNLADKYLTAEGGWSAFRSNARLFTPRQAALQVTWEHYIGNPVWAARVRPQKVSGDSSPEITKEQSSK